MVTIAKERRPLLVPNQSKTIISSSIEITGSVQIVGALNVSQGVTGSIKEASVNKPFILAGANISTNYNSHGQWVITGTGGGSGEGSGGGTTTPVEVVDTDITLTNESVVNVIGLTAPRLITLPSSPTVGKTIQILNGDGSASSSKYVLATGSLGQLVDSKIYPQPALIQPYSFVQYIYTGNNWLPTFAKTKTLEESWIDVAAAINTSAIYAGNQNVTIGIQFTCVSDSLLFGYRLKLNLDSPKEFYVKVWSNNQELISRTITLTGSSDKRYFFDTPISLNKGQTYFLTFRETSGVYFYYIGSLGGAGYTAFPANYKTTALILNAAYCYGDYDSQPYAYLNQAVGVFAPIEPIIFA